MSLDQREFTDLLAAKEHEFAILCLENGRPPEH